MIRIDKIVSEISPCNILADIGCDHGYIAKKAIEKKLCKKLIISDISEKSLKKAETLLTEYITKGICIPVVSDGFQQIDYCDCAVIAGMGGEEIVKIIENSKFLPENLVLQPMKNCDKVREISVEYGYKIIKDYVFYFSGKYYTLIKLVKGKDSLTEEEIEFGRTNITDRPLDFVSMINKERSKLFSYLHRKNIGETAKREIESRIERLSKYV